MKSKNSTKQKLSSLAKGGLTVVISVLIISVIVKAGSLTPTSSPAATSYTLTDIYNRLNTNTVATEGNHDFAPGASPAGSFYSLTQIYDKIPTITANTVKSGTSYLGVDGTLVPDGTATESDCLNTKTFYSGDSWTQKTGSLATQTLSAASVTVTAGNYAATTLSVVDVDLVTGNIKSGINLFGIDGNGSVVDTSSGDAATSDILSGKIAWVDGMERNGAMANNGAFGLTCGASDVAVTAGYYSGGTLLGDTDLAAGNILSGVNIFGVAGSAASGYTYGDEDQSKVLTIATGVGTYDATNLSISNVRYGQSFGVSSTGTMSSYPNTPSGISGLDSTVCATAGWTWVADSNYDSVNDDPICVQPSRDSAGTKVWNNTVAVNDNTFIGNYGCSGDNDGNGVGTLNTTLSGTVFENTGYGDDANTALAIADCKDGIRNLLSKAEVETFGYTAPNTSSATTGYIGPLTPKKLLEWKGTRLPTHNDFFGVCGNATTSETFGNYGVQIGRIDNVITANIGTWEWLSTQHYNIYARVAGGSACSNFNGSGVTAPYGFRAVFRP